MNCKELVYLLGEYLDGSMDERLRRELDAHIEMCDSCLHFLRTYDRTVLLCRQVRMEEIPPEFAARLESFVMDRAEEFRREIEGYRRRALEDRRQRVAGMLLAYREQRLSPSLELLFESHRDRCPTCSSYLRSVGDGSGGEISEELEEHLASFFESLPPGEFPYGR